MAMSNRTQDEDVEIVPAPYAGGFQNLARSPGNGGGAAVEIFGQRPLSKPHGRELSDELGDDLSRRNLDGRDHSSTASDRGQ